MPSEGDAVGLGGVEVQLVTGLEHFLEVMIAWGPVTEPSPIFNGAFRGLNSLGPEAKRLERGPYFQTFGVQKTHVIARIGLLVINP